MIANRKSIETPMLKNWQHTNFDAYAIWCNVSNVKKDTDTMYTIFNKTKKNIFDKTIINAHKENDITIVSGIHLDAMHSNTRNISGWVNSTEKIQFLKTIFNGQLRKIYILFNGLIYNKKDLEIEIQLKNNISCVSPFDILINYYLEFGFDKLIKCIYGIYSLIIIDITDKTTIYIGNDTYCIKPLFFWGTFEPDNIDFSFANYSPAGIATQILNPNTYLKISIDRKIFDMEYYNVSNYIKDISTNSQENILIILNKIVTNNLYENKLYSCSCVNSVFFVNFFQSQIKNFTNVTISNTEENIINYNTLKNVTNLTYTNNIIQPIIDQIKQTFGTNFLSPKLNDNIKIIKYYLLFKYIKEATKIDVLFVDTYYDIFECSDIEQTMFMIQTTPLIPPFISRIAEHFKIKIIEILLYNDLFRYIVSQPLSVKQEIRKILF